MYNPHLCAGCIFQLLWNPHEYLSTRSAENGIFNIYVLGKVVTVAADSSHFHTIFRKLDFYSALDNIQLDKILGDYAVTYKAHEFLGLLRKQFLPTYEYLRHDCTISLIFP